MNLYFKESEWKLSYCIPFEGKFKNYLTTIHVDRIEGDRDKFMRLSQCLKTSMLFVLKRYLKHRISTYSKMDLWQKTSYCINVQTLLVHAHSQDLNFLWGVISSTDWESIAPKKENKWTEVIARVLDFYTQNLDLPAKLKSKIEGGANV